MSVLTMVVAACGCGGGGASTSAGGTSTATTEASCPAAWKAGWQAWANRVGERVYCPSFLPNPITGEIHGQWNTALAPGKRWQIGYAWLEHDDLVHVVFEGYPASTWPPSCEGVPCFAGRIGTEDVGGRRVIWYDHNQASHTGHVAAVFRTGGIVYVVSMHISRPYGTEQKTQSLVRQMVAGLVPLDPSR